jgi:lysophospholipase L1-like esterase
MRDAFRHLARPVATLCLVLALACGHDSTPVATHKKPAPAPKPAVPVKMLSLGDSYTSGESIAPVNSWPYQLVDSLAGDSVRVTSLKVVAYTGWTTSDLIVAMNKNHLQPGYDLVTLQIGVNNQYQELRFSLFQDEFRQILGRATALTNNRADHVVVVTIPDYSVTPYGQNLDQSVIQTELAMYNGFIATTADSAGAHVIDIFDLSREAQDDPTMIARDGLHYSGAMYAKWVAVIRPVVARIFDR